MNNVINKFLLAGDKFMPEIHLRQPQFTYSACGPFTNVLTSSNDHVRNENVVNIYIVYKLDPLASNRDLLYKMLYLELYKLLKMLLIVIKIIIKDMVYVLMKEVSLVIQ